MWTLELLTLEEIESHYGRQSQAASQSAVVIQECASKHILPIGTFIVGRNNVDISLGDKSVSRKHAHIVVSEVTEADISNGTGRPGITVTDLGSTYGTYLNQTQERLKAKVPQELQHGDVVRFGQQCAAVRVLWQPVILCMSRTNKQEKADLKSWSRKVGAQLVSEWGSNVTHLITAKALTYTVKVMVAIISGVPIVSPAWLEAILSRSHLFDPLPAVEAFALPSTNISEDFRLGDLAEQQKKHLKGYIAISLAPLDEGEDLLSVSGATLFKLYPDNPSSIVKKEVSDINSEHNFTDSEFTDICELLQSSCFPITKPSQKAKYKASVIHMLEKRCYTTMVLLSPVEKAMNNPVIKSRFDTLAQVLPVVNTSTIAQSLLNLDEMLDVNTTSIPKNTWEKTSKAASLPPPQPSADVAMLPPKIDSVLLVSKVISGSNSDGVTAGDAHSGRQITKRSLLPENISTKPPSSSSAMGGRETKEAKRSEANSDVSPQKRKRNSDTAVTSKQVEVTANSSKQKRTSDEEEDQHQEKRKKQSTSDEGNEKVENKTQSKEKNKEKIVTTDTATFSTDHKRTTQKSKVPIQEQEKNHVSNNDDHFEEDGFGPEDSGYPEEEEGRLTENTPVPSKPRPFFDTADSGQWMPRKNNESSSHEHVSSSASSHGGGESLTLKKKKDDDNFGMKPEVEEVSLICLTGTVNAATSKKQKKIKSSGPNFKKFRKNEVNFGPNRRVRLELVMAEENERVQHMRREEAAAAHYERVADQLFGEGEGASSKSSKRKQ